MPVPTNQPRSTLKRSHSKFPDAGPSNLSKFKHKPSPLSSSTLAADPHVLKGSKGKLGAKHSVSMKVRAGDVGEGESEDESEIESGGFDDEFDVEADEDHVSDGGGEGEGSTGDEIEGMKVGEKKSKMNTKRKRPPTTASIFGSTLTSLLSDPTNANSTPLGPSTDDLTRPVKKQKQKQKPKTKQNPILSLSTRKLPPSKAAITLEAKAAKLLKVQKEEKEDRARIRNVVEGWIPAGPADGVEPGATNTVGSQEFERGLRKVAQRGVIKLFNAILIASKNADEENSISAAQAKLKPDLPKNKRDKDNVLGRGGKKEDVLTKESFLDLVRKGGTR